MEKYLVAQLRPQTAAKIFGHFYKGKESIEVEFVGRSAGVVVNGVDFRVSRSGQAGQGGERGSGVGTR